MITGNSVTMCHQCLMPPLLGNTRFVMLINNIRNVMLIMSHVSNIMLITSNVSNVMLITSNVSNVTLITSNVSNIMLIMLDCPRSGPDQVWTNFARPKPEPLGPVHQCLALNLNLSEPGPAGPHKKTTILYIYKQWYGTEGKKPTILRANLPVNTYTPPSSKTCKTSHCQPTNHKKQANHDCHIHILLIPQLLIML
jgi:hypothetical protein